MTTQPLQPPMPSVARTGTETPTFHVSSFNISATSNEVVVFGNEVHPGWAAGGAPQPAVSVTQVLLRMSPQSLKDLADMLQSFVAKYEANYGELQTDYLRRKAAQQE
jgi:hypothetical protein